MFLPLDRQQANLLTADDSLPEEHLAQWTVSSLASVLAIQSVTGIATLGSPLTRLEKSLAGLIEAGVDMERAGQRPAFTALVASRVNKGQFALGLSLLRSISAKLLYPDDVDAEDYLTEAGKWDFDFAARHSEALNPFNHPAVDAQGQTFYLSDQQARTFHFMRAEMDEDFHLQALAGTGKTFMIERMIDCLSAYRPLVLAMTKVQLDALQLRVGAGRVDGMTCSQLANQSLGQDLTKGGTRAYRVSKMRVRVDMRQIAEHLGFQQIGPLTPKQVASVTSRAVYRFCISPDREIGLQHLPAVGSACTAADKAMLVRCAWLLWNETLYPSATGVELPVRGYHRIKQASLDPGVTMLPGYTHVIVDEAHDMPVPMAQFLDRSSIPVITLGDTCQRMDGVSLERAPTVRRREIYQSIRSGLEMETAVNTLIEKNPVVSVHPLQGNRQQDTEVTFYSRAAIPERPTTILVWSEWGLFEWFQRLGAAEAKFSLLPGIEAGFRWFVLDCIGLYREGLRPSHAAIFKFTTWDDLRSEVGKGEDAFARIDRMLEKGYTERHFESSLMQMDQTGQAPYKLGTVASAKNTERDSVMLTPELLQSTGSNRQDAARAFAAIYTGGTRARNQLYVPGHLKDWAVDVAARVNSTSKASPSP